MVEKIYSQQQKQTYNTGLYNKTGKTKFLDANEPQFVLQIKTKSVQQANDTCDLKRTWLDWDDLYSGTFGKAAHGKFTGVFRTYYGISNTLGTICQKCPLIMQKAYDEMKNHEHNQ